MISGIQTRLGPSTPSRVQTRVVALHERAQQAVTRAQQKRVKRSLDSLIEREPSALEAVSSYFASIMPPGLQSPLEKQILMKKMLGDITPKHLTNR